MRAYSYSLVRVGEEAQKQMITKGLIGSSQIKEKSLPVLSVNLPV